MDISGRGVVGGYSGMVAWNAGGYLGGRRLGNPEGGYDVGFWPVVGDPEVWRSGGRFSE